MSPILRCSVHRCFFWLLESCKPEVHDVMTTPYQGSIIRHLHQRSNHKSVVGKKKPGSWISWLNSACCCFVVPEELRETQQKQELLLPSHRFQSLKWPWKVMWPSEGHMTGVNLWDFWVLNFLSRPLTGLHCTFVAHAWGLVSKAGELLHVRFTQLCRIWIKVTWY